MAALHLRPRRLSAALLAHRAHVFLLWPGFITQWNPEGIWGAVVLGLPRGEIAWAFAFGAFWPVFVGYVFDVRIERRERASGRVARLEPGMAAPTPEGP